MIRLSITLKNRREAYENVKPKRDSRKALILNILENGDPGGMTAEEIEVVGKRRSFITTRNTAVWKVVKH